MSVLATITRRAGMKGRRSSTSASKHSGCSKMGPSSCQGVPRHRTGLAEAQDETYRLVRVLKWGRKGGRFGLPTWKKVPATVLEQEHHERRNRQLGIGATPYANSSTFANTGRYHKKYNDQYASKTHKIYAKGLERARKRDCEVSQLEKMNAVLQQRSKNNAACFKERIEEWEEKLISVHTDRCEMDRMLNAGPPRYSDTLADAHAHGTKRRNRVHAQVGSPLGAMPEEQHESVAAGRFGQFDKYAQ